ncbi:hypothetical protein F4775DRAFT_250959 [Biscogniauxia sp. FL1348]|nr:hypothetical protein F4775DRAFT_250959 [Biscogniauxia sp. FL1348]
MWMITFSIPRLVSRSRERSTNMACPEIHATLCYLIFPYSSFLLLFTLRVFLLFTFLFTSLFSIYVSIQPTFASFLLGVWTIVFAYYLQTTSLTYNTPIYLLPLLPYITYTHTTTITYFYLPHVNTPIPPILPPPLPPPQPTLTNYYYYFFSQCITTKPSPPLLRFLFTCLPLPLAYLSLPTLPFF